MIDEQGYDIDKRWQVKRNSVHNLKNNIERLKRTVRADLYSSDEKAQLTALIIRIMMNTSERVGNSESAKNGHFGVTHFRKKHITVIGNTIHLNYIGKSGVDHEKSFSDEASAQLLKKLIERNKGYLFVTESGFQIKPDKINRYLKRFGIKSKDLRGFNANRMMSMELSKYGYIKEDKDRKKIFNESLRKVAKKIGHGPTTLRKQYLLPEIEEQFYSKGKLKKGMLL